jgi:medium-chain acyl-[acyl-carrier-protein] hydrolase
VIEELPGYADWTNGVLVRTEDEAVRLFCLPYAGGGASVFRFLKADLAHVAGVYPIQLPGREGRWQQRPHTDLPDLIRALDDGLGPILDRPFALFGHSMGAFIAFEWARHLRRQHRPGPALLAVSGARAPQIPDPDPPVHGEPPGRLLAEMTRLDGIPREVLQHPEFVDLLLPILRADLAVCETYRYLDEPPLDCPIVVYGGAQDEKVPSALLLPWRVQTTASFQVRLFPGKHFFFVNESRAAVAQALASDVQSAVGATATPTLKSRADFEGAIAQIWRDVLHLPKVGLDDNFFDLGGNSLLAIQAHAKLRHVVSQRVSVLDLFRYPTVRSLAGTLGTSKEGVPHWARM